MDNDCGYISFWKKKIITESKPEFTEMELAVMEGGHSIEELKVEKFSFIKSLQTEHLP